MGLEEVARGVAVMQQQAEMAVTFGDDQLAAMPLVILP
jgi:hypothetical protein